MRTLPIFCVLLALGLVSGCSTARIADRDAAQVHPIVKQIASANAAGCRDPAMAICQFDVLLVDKREPNAFLDRQAGRIRITTGMLARSRDRSEIAFVIAHELAHVELGHRRKFFGGRRAQESEADWRAAEMLHAAGFDPTAGIRLLQRLARGFGQHRYASTHPSFMARAKRLASHWAVARIENAVRPAGLAHGQ